MVRGSEEDDASTSGEYMTVLAVFFVGEHQGLGTKVSWRGRSWNKVYFGSSLFTFLTTIPPKE
jgi:hypothetical protein